MPDPEGDEVAYTPIVREPAPAEPKPKRGKQTDNPAVPATDEESA